MPRCYERVVGNRYYRIPYTQKNFGQVFLLKYLTDDEFTEFIKNKNTLSLQ